MVRKYKPRPGKRQYTKYDPEIIKKALQQHANSNDSLSRIANEYQISKSVLHRRIHKTNYNNIGGQTAFSSEREEHIIKYINACTPWQYNLQSWDLRLLIKFYLDRRPLITKRKFDNNLPGQELVANFLKRHEDTISQRIIQNLNCGGSVSVEAVLSYFHEFKMAITDADPNNIVCYNDTLITDDIDKSKRDTEEAKSNEIFVMTAVSVSGEMLNPYIMYKDQRCYDRTRRSMSMAKQPRSRLKGNIFEEWFKSVILPFFEGKPGKKCLVGSYFSSRISVELLNVWKEQNIHIVFLPDNSSNLTQPLDALSQLIHAEWKNMLHQKITEGNPTTEEYFREMVQTLTSNAAGQILEDLKRTGINPINPAEVFKQLPNYNETTIEDLDEEFEKLEMMRNDNMDAVQVKEEVEWVEEYIDDSFDEEMASIEDKITVSNNRNLYKTSSKSKGIGKKTKHLVTMETDCGTIKNQNNLMILDFKLSPTDFEEDICEDTTGDYLPEDTLEIDEATVGSPKQGNLTRKTKRFSSDPNKNEIYYVAALQEKNTTSRHATEKNKTADLDSGILDVIGKEKDKTEDTNSASEIDPRSHGQNVTNVHTSTTTFTSECPAEGANRSNHRGNDTCNTHTLLLESIQSSMTRQEIWQERAARAMEAQAQALANIARLLEGRAVGSNLPE